VARSETSNGIVTGCRDGKAIDDGRQLKRCSNRAVNPAQDHGAARLAMNRYTAGNSITLLASLAGTCAAYSYRVKVEDTMLIEAFGPSYAEYRQRVRALLPSFRSSRLVSH